MSADRLTLDMTVERPIKHEEQNDYYLEIPFRMPEHTEDLYVEMEISSPGQGHCVIDLGVVGPSRIRGWSGGARQAFHIGAERATPGYLPGPLTPGTWAVLLGAYRVPPEGCLVKIRIQCQPKRYRWLKGDLHSHTVHSDGSYTIAEAIRIMEELGCDFLAMTDHNTASQNHVCPKISPLVLIPGYELTTNDGHANFLGAVDPVDDFRVRRMDDIRHHFQTAKNRGARRVLNHIKCDRLPWKWSFDVDYDYVEIWNGPWLERNQRALDWWQQQLSAGRRIIAVGGSDVHKPHPLVKHGTPTTWVYAHARAMEDILAAMDRGHVFVSCSPRGPTIDFHIGDCMMGDTLEPGSTGAPVPVEANLSLGALESGDRIKILSDWGKEAEWVSEAAGEFSYSWTVADRRFYRVEIWRYAEHTGHEALAAVSNPIYLQ